MQSPQELVHSLLHRPENIKITRWKQQQSLEQTQEACENPSPLPFIQNKALTMWEVKQALWTWWKPSVARREQKQTKQNPLSYSYLERDTRAKPSLQLGQVKMVPHQRSHLHVQPWTHGLNVSLLSSCSAWLEMTVKLPVFIAPLV